MYNNIVLNNGSITRNKMDSYNISSIDNGILTCSTVLNAIGMECSQEQGLHKICLLLWYHFSIAGQ